MSKVTTSPPTSRKFHIELTEREAYKLLKILAESNGLFVLYSSLRTLDPKEGTDDE